MSLEIQQPCPWSLEWGGGSGAGGFAGVRGLYLTPPEVELSSLFEIGQVRRYILKT